VGFKRELIKEVKMFVVDAQFFRKDWEANGPMVTGLDPMEAVDRLKKFQQMFEVGAWCHCFSTCECCMCEIRS
jgi:dynein heavy chain, axonemal